jgi:hypothetical protein
VGALNRRIGLIVLVAVLALIGPSAGVGAQTAGDGGPIVELSPRQGGIKGIVGHWWYLEPNLARFLDAYADLGVTTVRITVDWRQIEPEPGRWDFARTDRLFGALIERGIEPVPVFATIPAWASLNPEACRVKELSCEPDPDKLAGLEITSLLLVSRYPRVTRWEFWNEPEMWPGMADPSTFQRWHRAFYRGAKRANPNARVALGTLTGWSFVRALDHDLPFDAVTMHSFESHWSYPIDIERIELLRTELLGRGRDVPIWLTEYGWDSRWLGDQGRAETIRWVLDWLLDHPYIELAHYHMLHDTDDPETCCFGLLGPPPNYEPKRLPYEAFRAYVVKR